MIKLSRMLLDMGHLVYFYGAEGSTVPCTEHIVTHSIADISEAWGVGDTRFAIGYDWKSREGFKFDIKTPEQIKLTQKFWGSCINGIQERIKDDHYILTQGLIHKRISDQFPSNILKCESGVGYRAVSEKFKAFESSYIMNYIYGAEAQKDGSGVANVTEGHFYDRVIPNYFNPDHYHYQEKKENYFLYLGRLTPLKGIYIAMRLAETMGFKLLLAGQGSLEYNHAKNVEYVGYADIKTREKLMQNAKAVFYPTLYLEPFGGVVVEAGLCGTPVITTNFGAFPELVEQGVTGYRCDMFKDFKKAVEDIDKIKPMDCRKHAEPYLMQNVAPLYSKWFNDLQELYEGVRDGRGDVWYNI
jgi:glycosyltransferase involved in cell wall biosynthesis